MRICPIYMKYVYKVGFSKIYIYRIQSFIRFYIKLCINTVFNSLPYLLTNLSTTNC